MSSIRSKDSKTTFENLYVKQCTECGQDIWIWKNSFPICKKCFAKETEKL